MHNSFKIAPTVRSYWQVFLWRGRWGMEHLFIGYNTLKVNFTSKAIISLSDLSHRKLNFIGQVDTSIYKKHMNFKIYITVIQILYSSPLTGILLILLSEGSNTDVFFFNQTKLSGTFIIH